MTREEIRAHIDKLPQDLIEKYKLSEQRSWDNERCEMLNGYKYYPEAHALLVGSKIIEWETGHNDTYIIDPYNSVHFAELIKIGMEKQTKDTIGVIVFMTEGEMYCRTWKRDHWPSGRIHEADKFISFPFDNTEIFYPPEYEHILNQPVFKLLAECLFLVKRYNSEYIVPYKCIESFNMFH